MTIYTLLIKNLAGPGGTKYAVLQSFDLVCDSEKEQKLWCQAVSGIAMCTHIATSQLAIIVRYSYSAHINVFLLTVEETHFTEEACEHVF